MLQQRRKEERREKTTKLKIPSTQSEPKTTDVSTTRYSTDGLLHRPTSDVPASIAERNAHRRNRRRNRQESIIESLARTWKRGSLRSDYVKLPLWGLLPLCPLYHRFKTTSHRTAETGNTADRYASRVFNEGRCYRGKRSKRFLHLSRKKTKRREAREDAYTPFDIHPENGWIAHRNQAEVYTV